MGNWESFNNGKIAVASRGGRVDVLNLSGVNRVNVPSSVSSFSAIQIVQAWQESHMVYDGVSVTTSGMPVNPDSDGSDLGDIGFIFLIQFGPIREWARTMALKRSTFNLPVWALLSGSQMTRSLTTAQESIKCSKLHQEEDWPGLGGLTWACPPKGLRATAFGFA